MRKAELSVGMILFLLAISIFIVLFMQGKIVIPGQTQTPDITINVDIDDLIDDYAASDSCTLGFDKDRICTGENFRATLRDGENTACYILANDGTGWKISYNGVTDDRGVWSEENSIAITGDWQVVGICDEDNNKAFSSGDCITNIERLVVESCSSPTPPTNENGDVVGGISGSQTISGDNGLDVEVDMSSITEGNCALKAQIQYAWNYITPEECQGIQGSEGMYFAFYDSSKKVWETTSINPIGLGFETDCGLYYDGSTNWRFTADKTIGMNDCEIKVDYDIKVITCNCQD